MQQSAQLRRKARRCAAMRHALARALGGAPAHHLAPDGTVKVGRVY